MTKRLLCALLALCLALSLAPAGASAEAAAEPDAEALLTSGETLTGPIKDIALGRHHSAAIAADGSLWTWGRNEFGQLGDGTTTDRYSPVKVMDDVAAVSLGEIHSAALKTDGSLWTWGQNWYSQLGDGTTENRSRPVKIMDSVAAVSLGYRHSAAIKTDGSLWIWGSNGYCELGDGTTTNRSSPVRIMYGVASVSLGEYHSAAITTDGSLWIWGRNDNGQLGDGTTMERSSPVKIMDDVAAVSLGSAHSAAIKMDDSLWTWGANWYGQLGNGTTENRSNPVEVMDGIASVSLGESHSAALKTNGSLWMWGYNDLGQLGDGTETDRSSPVKNMDRVDAVSMGGYHSAVIKMDGSLWTWGNNGFGQLGNGMSTPQSSPVNIIASVAAVSLGRNHSAAITTDSSLWTWGDNNFGQLGDGTTTPRNSPVKIMEGVTAVSLGDYHSAALMTDGSVWLWGYNDYSHFGDGTDAKRNSPVKIMDGVAKVSLGSYHNAAIKTDGSLYTWGYNAYGQLGDGLSGNINNRTTPLKIMDDVVAVSLGGSHSAAIKTDASLWLWGYNGYGQLGDGTTMHHSSPVKIMDDVIAVSLGDFHSAAIKKDGTLWTWGWNHSGELGDGTNTDRSSPVKIMDNVAAVSLGGSQSAALMTDGSLWTWGRGYEGQLGDGTTSNRNSPEKIIDDVTAISFGGFHSAAIKTDGSLWAWGQNDMGELGIGTSSYIPGEIVHVQSSSYTVTFNANGGTGAMSAQTITADTSTALHANSFTRSGYTFSGWNTASNGGGTAYADKASVTLSANLTLYAQWTQNAPATYTVSFNANGGSGTMAAQSVTANTSTPLNANSFTRSGYTFSGWNTAVNGGGTAYADKANVTLSANLTLYAQWTRNAPTTYTVSFNANGGNGSMAAQTVTANTFTALSANSFTRSGYTFSGWNTASNGGGTAYADRASVTLNTNLTLYAQWTKIPDTYYTISFNANGGVGAMAEHAVKENTSTTLSANSFTRSGYTFTGWNTKADGTGEAYADRAAITPAADLTLYAQWTQNAPASYTISFNANGGEGKMSAQTVTAGAAAALNANRFTRDGYTFGGWATQAGGKKVYADREKVTPDADMELYAVWQLITYAVLYNANGGENAPPSDIKAYGDDLELSDAEPVREGYTFQGWSVKRDGEVKYQPGGVYSANAKVTLYAVWTRNNNSRIPSLAEDVSYGFGNTLNDFSYYRNIEAIPKRVFQLVFGVTQRAEEYFNRNKVWNGNCFGMTATAGILFADGDDYAPAAFSEGKARANQLSLSDQYKMGFLSLQEFIEALQVVQYSEIVQIDLAKNSFTTAYYTKPLNDLVAAVQYFEKTGNDPPVVAVYSAKGKGHALLGYKVDFDSEKSARLWVYDPNYPNNNTRYIKLNRINGEYTGWEYDISSKESWGSAKKGESRVSFVPYTDIFSAWQHRGAGLGSAGAVITADKDLEIKDVNGNGPPLVTIEDGVVSSNSPDIFKMDYLGVVLDENENIIDTGDGTVSVWLPADRYQVQWAGTPQNLLGAAPEDGLNLTLTHTDQSASVSTGASTIIIDVDDSQQLNYVRFAAADAGRSYDVTLNSTLDKTTEKVRLTGTVEEDGTALSQRKGNIGVSGADAATLYINTVKQDAGMGYAFSDVPCLVTVSAGGGSGTMPAIAVEADRNEKLVMPDCTLEAPLGFTFDCWKLDQNGALYQPGDSVELLGDAVITALWKATNDKYAVQSAETDGAAVTALVQNIRGTGGTALVSAYDGDGRLIDVAECKLPALKEGDAENILVELPLEGAAEVKIFICGNNLRPLCPAFTLELYEE